MNPPLNASRINYAEPLIENDMLDAPFLESELLAVLKRAKDNKAPGSDRIPFEFFKHAPQGFIKKLVTVFNKILEAGTVPNRFKDSIIFPIHKKGCTNETSNYRGISFCNTVSKLFTGLLLARLELWEQQHNKLGEFQAGFRKTYSTVDNIFTLMSIIKIVLSHKRQKLFAFFIDLSAAFDRIDRFALFYKLSRLGVSSKITSILKSYYTDTSATVWCRGGVSENFRTGMGVKQGCLLSPLLFSFFLNDLSDCMKGGITIQGTKINMLAYADDIVIFSTDRLELQAMIRSFENYCQTWNLVVNLSKSQIVVFRNGGRPGSNEKWYFENQKIKVSNSYKYLGMTLTSNLSLNAHFKERIVYE